MEDLIVETLQVQQIMAEQLIREHLLFFLWSLIYYAYLRRIAKEKRQQAIREKILERKGYEEVFHSDDLDNIADLNYIKSRVETNTRYN